MNIVKQIKQEFYDQIPFFIAIPALIWQCCLCVFPLLFILTNSFIDTTSGVSFTLAYYRNVFTFVHGKMILISLVLAGGTAFFCFIIGFPIAYWLARRAQKLKNLFLFFLIIPFWTNLLILIYSWLFILERNGLLDSFLQRLGILKGSLSILYTIPAVLLVTVYCYLPFMVLPIFTALEKIEKSVLEASSDLGATYFQTLLRVILPLSWPGIKTGVFLVFVPVFGEFAIPLLIGGGKYMFVGNAIAHYVFSALDLSTGAAFTVISSIALLSTIVVLMWLFKRILYRT